MAAPVASWSRAMRPTAIEPITRSTYATAEARGDFDLARVRKPVLANATAFLAALSKAFHDIGSPEYMDKQVVNSVLVRLAYPDVTKCNIRHTYIQRLY